MQLSGPHTYRLTVTGRSAQVRASDGALHFVAPATKAGRLKLYVVSNPGSLLYVGATSQPMSARLRGGLTANGTHGYHGYLWASYRGPLRLDIWYLDGQDAKPELEAIEAEVVFLYRHESGQWPDAQTEIHFRQSGASHRDCARRMLDGLWADIYSLPNTGTMRG